ncbi:MAG: hypothetical protein KAG86_05920, partial [Gammaproteobacteria bacterium]|nr:hypothetical protein [Gammaproteobacteria bacterium]
LHDLSPEQQQRVIETFEIKGKHEVIYNPVGLLIVLAKAEREGRLIIPKTSHHAAHQPFETTKKATDNKSDDKHSSVLEDHLGKLNWLKDNALLNNQSMPCFADSMRMSVYLEDTQFVQRWLIFHAKQSHQSIDQL